MEDGEKGRREIAGGFEVEGEVGRFRVVGIEGLLEEDKVEDFSLPLPFSDARLLLCDKNAKCLLL